MYNAAYSNYVTIKSASVTIVSFAAQSWAVGTANRTITLTSDQRTALLNAIPPQDCPALQLYCGAADALLASNERFAAAARLRGLPCRFERLPGGHEWGFWDEALGKTIKKWPLGG